MFYGNELMKEAACILWYNFKYFLLDNKSAMTTVTEPPVRTLDCVTYMLGISMCSCIISFHSPLATLMTSLHVCLKLKLMQRH